MVAGTGKQRKMASTLDLARRAWSTNHAAVHAINRVMVIAHGVEASRNRRPVSKLSKTVAWISTPGSMRLIGVGRKSIRPGALKPTSTKALLRTEGSSVGCSPAWRFISDWMTAATL